MSNQSLSRDSDDRSLRPHSEEAVGADQPTQSFGDITLPNLYPPAGRSMEWTPAVPQEQSSKPEATTVSPRSAGETAWFTIGKINQFLYWLLGVLEVWFLLRFFLKLVGARADNPFASFLYGTSAPLLLPFRTILPTTQLPGTSVIEWSTLIGMLVYALVTIAVIRFLRLLVTEPQV